MEEPYSKREEDTFRKEVIIRLDRIEIQTSKTNGRVNSLENWKYFLIGMGTFIVVVLIPIVVAIIQIYKK